MAKWKSKSEKQKRKSEYDRYDRCDRCDRWEKKVQRSYGNHSPAIAATTIASDCCRCDRWRVFVVSYDRYILIAGIVFFPSAIAAITAMVAIIWKPGFKLIMAYFKSKDCLQRNLCLKCVSLWKALKANCMVRLNKCSTWSRVLISVTWVELLWALYRFFRINNIDLKCSFVRCRKYYKSWWNGAAEPDISVDLLCGTTAAELQNSVDLLCGTTAAEQHNSVDLLWGTRAAELHNSVDLTLWHNGRRNFWKMNVLKDSAKTDR